MPAKPKSENPASDDGGFDDSFLDQSESARPVEIDSEGAFSSGADFEAQRPEEIEPDRPAKSSRPGPVEPKRRPSRSDRTPSGSLVGFAAVALSLLAIGGVIAEHFLPPKTESVVVHDPQVPAPFTPPGPAPFAPPRPTPLTPPDENVFRQAKPDKQIDLLKQYNADLFTKPQLSIDDIKAGLRWANNVKQFASGDVADMLDFLIKKMERCKTLQTSNVSTSGTAKSLQREVHLPNQMAGLQLAFFGPGVAANWLTGLYVEGTGFPTPKARPNWLDENDRDERKEISKDWARAIKFGGKVDQSEVLSRATESAWKTASTPADCYTVRYYLFESLKRIASADDDPRSWHGTMLANVRQRLADLQSELAQKEMDLAQKEQEKKNRVEEEIRAAESTLHSLKTEIGQFTEKLTTLKNSNDKKLNAEDFGKEFGSEFGRELGPNGKLAAIEKLKGGELVTMPQLQASVTSAIRSFVDMDILRQAVALAKRVGELSAKQTRMEGKFTTAVDKLDSATARQNRELQSAKNDLEKAQTNLEVVNKKIGKLEAINSGQLLTATKDAVNAVLARLDNWGYRPLQIPDDDRPNRSSSDSVTPAQAEKSGESFDLGYQAYFSERPGAQREAVRHLTMACRLEPRSALYRYFLGMAYYRLGDRESAAAEIRLGTELEERNSDTVGIYKGLEREQGTARQWMEHVREVVRTEFKTPS